MIRSMSEVAIFRSGSSTNCAQRKQYVQYEWHVWPCLGNTSTVSWYLCCTPGSGSSPRSGTFSASCPAGCGFSRIRISWTAPRSSASGAPLVSRQTMRFTSAAGSMAACGKTKRKIGSSGAASQSMRLSTT